MYLHICTYLKYDCIGTVLRKEMISKFMFIYKYSVTKISITNTICNYEILILFRLLLFIDYYLNDNLICKQFVTKSVVNHEINVIKHVLCMENNMFNRKNMCSKLAQIHDF